MKEPSGQTLPISQTFLEGHPLKPYLPVITPLLQAGYAALQEGIQALRDRYAFQPFDVVQVSESLLNTLIPLLLSQASKTLVLELHVARIEGRLQGEKPEERFSDFVRQISQDEARASLFAEYPVLLHLLTSTIDLWTRYALETLDHLCADWADIRGIFSSESDPGLLVEVQAGAGDTHRNGRSVQILRFSSGFCLLYKPRSLAIDGHFQELLAWLNERGAQPPFRLLKLLDRGNYGWCEFVEAVSCNSIHEVRRFYERQGEYLALCYALNMTDCHSENVIASGEYPLLVDLESLFHPHVADEDAADDASPALRFLDQSVLRVGLLPQWSWSSEESPGVDISGLGNHQGQIMPRPLPGWGDPGTDQMHLIQQPVEMPAKQNRPRLNDQAVHALDHTEDIVTGFTGMYRLLMNARDALLNEQLPRFAHDEIRVLVRPTRFYALLLAASFHPDLLRDPLEREKFFDRLSQGVEYWPDLARFLPAEREELLRGDIPLFTTFAESHMVFTSDGRPLFDVFRASALDLVWRQVSCMDERDLTRQTWVIRASLATLHMGSADQPGRTLSSCSSQTPPGRERLLALARAVGERLEELALQNADGASWVGVNLLRENTWGLSPAGMDLYDGVSGIAFFLSYLGAITGEARFTSLARRAFAQIHAYLALVHEQAEDQNRDRLAVNPGAFDGWGSFLYLLTHLSVLWDEPALLHEAEELVECLPELIARDEHFDILSGSAGCLLSILSLYVVRPSPRVLEVAVQCGDRLLATAQTLPIGVGWVTNREEPPLGGFSHGSSGIALSLLKLADASGEARFRRTALAALEFDRSLFLPAQQNWADLRVSSTRLSEKAKQSEPVRRCMVTWCHGAPGIGLARLAALKQMDDPRVREEIDTAINTTMRYGLDGNHSLCHGALGNIELLLTAARLLNRHEDQARLKEALARAVGSMQAHGRVTGVPLGVETPGLMTGLAGIGYELLRLAEPDGVPSLLVLAPPACTSVNPRGKGDRGS